MEVKPGYKQTEVGVIPEEWEVKQLGGYVCITSGESPAMFHFTTSGLPYFKVEQLSNSEKYLHSFSTPYHFKSGKTVPRGSVVFAKRGGAIALNKVRILGQESFMDTNLMALTPTDELDGEFLYYGLGYVGLWRFADTTSVPQINNKHVKPLAFRLPPLPEQRAIATALRDVDGLLGGLDRLITKKRDLKQAAMQQLLTGQTRLPGFHGEWEVKSLPEVCQFRGGKAHEQYIAEHGRFVCVNSKFISTEGKVRKYATKNFCCAKAKDILMVMSDLPNGKALAKTFVADRDDLYAVNQRVCALTAFDNYCAEFLAYILDRNPYFLKFDDGVSQTHLLNRVFEKCPLFLAPTKDEQIAISEVVTDMDTELAALEQRREKTRALKQGMMQELLTGRTRLL